MDRRHPRLDRLEATHSPAPLKSTCLFLLRLHWSAVTDVGDTPYDLISTLLPHSTAPQLLEIEANSPHIAQHTNHIWRDLCVHEFIEVRKAVEDGRMKKEDEPASWREQYAEEEVKREVKMQAILSKMRGRYEDYKEGRASTQLVNGAAQERRRKAAHGPARPKTLFDKARSNAKGIKAIYAPKKRFSGIGPRPSPSTAAPSALQPTAKASAPVESKPKAHVSPVKRPADRPDEPPAKRKRPLITTVTRRVSRPASAVSTASSSQTSPATSPPPSSRSSSTRPLQGVRTPSFSPPPPLSSLSIATHARPVAALPHRDRVDPYGTAIEGKGPHPPQQSPAANRPPLPRPSAGIFMPKKR
ncbi:hypothetical protein NBRC10512_001741 [Rhodotorula toruloides]|uniref:RHTO0S07e01266g1_1 n=2 Tax=Rhodotorula toruloides TaxID=5286 RepID=A0A061AYG9_RHOTO|nr:RNA polymerase II transcription factor SIII, subunit A [Rhodotorula toruloides NP11]EMS24994.1 RNA polymerase II transcription factor SIII, subunit A [Rhodotorula toruloides NP11]CDR42564.1 RHTO0S07e01266g1_1 [Rhodotorula toruloides]